MKIDVRSHFSGIQSISGLAQSNDSGYLAVHDTKVEQPGARLSRYEPTTGELESVDVDWSATGLANDLEGITRMDGSLERYMAVEGSKWEGRVPKLFTLSYKNGKAVAETQHPLPELPHEIEGVATKSIDNRKLLVLVGGRGEDIDDPGRLHWAIYDQDADDLSWSEDGLKGVPVTLPHELGPGQRTISDLQLTPNGDLWGSAARDEGDEGPFESMIYRIGSLNGNSANPVTLSLDHPHHVEGNKVEALAMHGRRNDTLFFGCDNETFGGSLNSALFTV
jgi:hypothetical protein